MPLIDKTSNSLTLKSGEGEYLLVVKKLFSIVKSGTIYGQNQSKRDKFVFLKKSRLRCKSYA